MARKLGKGSLCQGTSAQASSSAACSQSPAWNSGSSRVDGRMTTTTISTSSMLMESGSWLSTTRVRRLRW